MAIQNQKLQSSQKSPGVKHLVRTLIPLAFVCNYLLAAAAVT